MKFSLVFFLSTFALTQTAAAMPTVGDHAVYRVVKKQDGTTRRSTIDVKLTESDGAGRLNQRTVITIEGAQPQAIDEVVDSSALLGDNDVAEILQHCRKHGGHIKAIKVPAGAFNACAMGGDGNVTWIARVPFGLVRKEETSVIGSHTVYELQSFEFGR